MRTIVREIREQLGVSRYALIKRTGIGENHITKIERNQVDPQIGTLAKIARALGVKISDLIEED